jgi:hypothetical protein
MPIECAFWPFVSPSSPNEPIFSHQPHMDTFYLPNNFYHHSKWNWNASLNWIWRHEIKGGSLINNVITWGIVYHEHQPKYQAKVLNSFAHVFVWFWSNIFFVWQILSFFGKKSGNYFFKMYIVNKFSWFIFWENLQYHKI